MENLLLFLICILYIYSDLKYKKIFNILSYPLIILLITGNTMMYGMEGLINSILGFILGMLICLLPQKLHICHYGEYKMLAVLGCLNGVLFIFKLGAIIYFLIALLWIINLLLFTQIEFIASDIINNFEKLIVYGISIFTIYDELQIPIIPYTLIVSTACLICIAV